jgi:hypothetical protein
MSRFRYFTFVARCPFDAPYELQAGDPLYCEWNYCSKQEIVEGYIQYKHPRSKPTWPHTTACFVPATLKYMVTDYKPKHYSFGNPVMPLVHEQPPSAPADPRMLEFFSKAREQHREEVTQNLLAKRKRKDEARANRKPRRPFYADYFIRKNQIENSLQ